LNILSFKDWFIKETTTTTAGIAQFKMPLGLIIRRRWPAPISNTKKEN
jgi:hypothetical protein